LCKPYRHNKTISVNEGFAGVLRICDLEQIDGEEMKDESLFVYLPVGELPRHLLKSADRYACIMVIPGSRVTVTGIFTTMAPKSGVFLEHG
jgi:DNA replication licensing factor MCM5